jgi:predicted  nucleic acid-binding Zn-ribbon protein
LKQEIINGYKYKISKVMVKFNSEQLDDLLSHLKDLWDEAKDKLGDYSEELEKIKDEVKPEWDKAKQEMKEYYQQLKK